MLLQQFINGITIGSTYALVAIGFTMIFGVLELTNFSNSSLYMFGAYVTWLLYGVGMNFFVAFALSIALTAWLQHRPVCPAAAAQTARAEALWSDHDARHVHGH